MYVLKANLRLVFKHITVSGISGMFNVCVLELVIQSESAIW
jgi:hypothetical protein